MPLPETPDGYIDWLLLSQEADNMQLYDSPAYRNKINVFLRVRSLMLLKQEEISDRIPAPTRDDLWPMYEEKYVPRFNLRLLSVEDSENRTDVEKLLAQGERLADIAKKVGLADSPLYMEKTDLLRPARLPAPLLEAVGEAQSGAIGGPVAVGEFTYFYEVLERDNGSDEDLKTLWDRLARQWRKAQEHRLTADLVEVLRKKYPVEVNDDLLARIGLDPLSSEDAESIVLKIDESQVSGRAFQEALAKDVKLRHSRHQVQEEMLEVARKRVIGDMVSQTLTSIEALARHYEEREPFNKTYLFYCQNSLVKAFQRAVIAPQVSVSEADIEAAYQANIADYTRKGMVELAMVQTKEAKLAQRVEEQLLRGANFEQTVAPLAPLGVTPRKVPLNHLPEPVKDVLEDMAPGQVSRMVPIGEEFVFVRLIGKGEDQVAPLDMVRGQLEEELQQALFQQVRADLLSQLRERSHIKLKSRAWKQVVEQLKREQE